MNSSHQIFMNRAFLLAQKSLGNVSPNPMVGCVIVHDNKIIGEGYHEQYGQAHAEVNAINSVVDKSLLRLSTAYVYLEPCAHHGKTPPCAELLVKHQIKKVFIANRDPFSKVNGKGISILEQANIKVISGVLAKKGSEINRRFFTFHHEKRPYIILKWAQTKDGFIARENYDSKWISNTYARKLVHKWRSEEDAIMVATNTAKHDNPSLNVRSWKGKNPLRIVIDKTLRLENTLHLFDNSIPTICYNLKLNEQQGNLEYVKLAADNFIELLFKDLYHRDIQSIIVEGGSMLLQSLIENKLWDEARVFSSETKFECGIKAPELNAQLIAKQDVFGNELKILMP